MKLVEVAIPFHLPLISFSQLLSLSVALSPHSVSCSLSTCILSLYLWLLHLSNLSFNFLLPLPPHPSHFFIGKCGSPSLFVAAMAYWILPPPQQVCCLCSGSISLSPAASQPQLSTCLESSVLQWIIHSNSPAPPLAVLPSAIFLQSPKLFTTLAPCSMHAPCLRILTFCPAAFFFSYFLFYLLA